MIVPVIVSPSSVLNQKAKTVSKVDKKTKELIRDLTDTLKGKETLEISGAGLAAPQIGVSRRVFVVKIRQDFVSFINPEIRVLSKEVSDSFEGCFSIPNYFGTVKRFSEITVKTLNQQGKTVKRKFKGFYAQVIQHENDHLDGILFTDLLKEQGGKLYKYLGTDKEGKDRFSEVVLE
ncbi:peptide deformylase [Patescibacteria group bacterium]|nr:peptide deformylase [Patescibacteria group bacterium]